MSEQQQNDSQHDSIASLTSMHIESYEEGITKNHAEVEQREAAARQAQYDFRDAGNQYGGGRSLRVPDANIKKAHYVHPSQHTRSQTRSRARSHSSRHQSRVQHGRWHDTPTSNHPTYAGKPDSSFAPYAKGYREGYDGPGWAAWFLQFLGLSKGSAK